MTFKGVAFILCGICIIVFAIQAIFPVFTEYISLEQQSWSQLWRFFTALFAHGSLSHLLYNILALALFGSILESIIGERRLLVIFLFTGMAANVVSIFVYPSSLGASGAIFGIIGTLVMLRPGMSVFAFGLPMPMFIAAILWAVGDIIGLFIPSNIANMAHLVGLAFGLVLGAILRQPNQNKVKRQKVVIDEDSMIEWEKNYLR